MRYTVSVLRRAEADLSEIYDHVAQDSPRQAVEMVERVLDRIESLSELPHLYRSVLHLHYWLGMTVSEIGEALDAPPGTVKSYMHRARAKLNESLKEKGLHHV